MSDAHSMLERIQCLSNVSGAVVWKLGETPVGTLPAPATPVAPGLLSAGVGSMEQVVEIVGLGQIEDLWFLTDSVQCLAIRWEDWQAVVTTSVDTDVGGLRDKITEALRVGS